MARTKQQSTQNSIRAFFKKCVYASLEDITDNSGIMIYEKSMFNSYDQATDKIIKPLDDKKSKEIFTMKTKISEIFDYIIKECRDNVADNQDTCPYVKRAINVDISELDENLENVDDESLIKENLKARENNKSVEMEDTVETCSNGIIYLIKHIAKSFASYLFVKKVSLDEKLLLLLIVSAFDLPISDTLKLINNKSIEYKVYEPKSKVKKKEASQEEKESDGDTLTNDEENEATQEDIDD